MTFEQYVVAINELARRDCQIADDADDYCDPQAWRDAFDDGLTPAEAWANECDAAQY